MNKVESIPAVVAASNASMARRENYRFVAWVLDEMDRVYDAKHGGAQPVVVAGQPAPVFVWTI